MGTTPLYVLLDNGSLEPAATLNLRGLAAALSGLLKESVVPVSLLHSHKVDAGLLGGQAAVILEPWLKRQLAQGHRRFHVLPLFFGPSGAIVEYLPARLELLRRTWPELELSVAPFLGQLRCADGWGLAELLEEHAREALRGGGDSSPGADGAPVAPGAAPAAPAHVVLVDHGSPRAEVTALRNQLAETLRERLGGAALSVTAASMERREGAEYDFNEPLLERALRELPEGASRVVVVPLFVSPGRHAGPGGDIAGICAAAREARPGLRVEMARLVGEHPRLVELLARGV